MSLAVNNGGGPVNETVTGSDNDLVGEKFSLKTCKAFYLGGAVTFYFKYFRRLRTKMLPGLTILMKPPKNRYNLLVAKLTPLWNLKWLK